MTSSEMFLFRRSSLLSLGAAFLAIGSVFSQIIPLEPFSPASDVPLSDALVATRSGTLASSAPNPTSVYSMEAIAGQAILFEIEASGLGQFRVRVEDPDGEILQESSLGDGESEWVLLIAAKTGRHFVRLQPLTVEDVFYEFSISLNLLLDEEGNGTLLSAQLIEDGPVPTGFQDRAITVKSESGESTEFFQIDLEAGESLSLAAKAQGINIELWNSLGESLASSHSDVSGLTALIEGYASTFGQAIFIEVSNPSGGDYDLVTTISSPEETLTPPLKSRLTFDQSRPYSNIQNGVHAGILLDAEGFSKDTYRVSLEANQAISLSMSKAGDGEVSYLLESPGRVPLRQGLVEGVADLSFTAVEEGDYYLTLATSGGELTSYSAGIVSNLVMESAASNDRESEAYLISYGWAKLAGCARLLTLSGRVGLGSDRFDQEPNNNFEEAQDLDFAEWTFEASEDIQDSTTVPHTSMRGNGDETKDLYRVVARVPNSRLICDIDRSFSLDSFLRVFDSEGNLVEEDNNSETSEGAGGSSTKNDSFIDVELSGSGIYYIEVGRNGGDGELRNNDGYELHVSLENHRLQTVPKSDPHDFYQIDLVDGELLTLACYQGDPEMEVFENGNPLAVEFYSRFDLPQLLTYRAESDVSLIVKMSNELVSRYDLLVMLNAGLEDFSHPTPATAMNIGPGEPTLAWIPDDLPDFYRVSFSNDDVRSVTVSQVDQGGLRTSLGIAVYNLSQELVMTSAPSNTNQASVLIPGELGNDLYIAVTHGEQLPALYLLQVGDAATECRDVFPSGTFAVDWQVVPDQAYQVEFSSNLQDWTLIPEVVSSSTSILQWIDAGPPRTDAAPGVERGSRYYRLVSPEE